MQVEQASAIETPGAEVSFVGVSMAAASEGDVEFVSMRNVREEAERRSKSRLADPSASVGHVGGSSEISQEGAWSLAGQVPDRCVRVTHYGRRPVWDELMFLDGQFRYVEVFAARAREFRTLIPAHIDFKWKSGSWVQFPIRPVTISAQLKVLGRSASFYTLSYKVDERDHGLWDMVCQWCMDHPGWALAVRRAIDVFGN